MKTLIFALIAFAGINAHASGGFNCEFANQKNALKLHGVTSWGHSGHIVQMEATVNNLEGVPVSLDKSAIAQYWTEENIFNIILHTEIGNDDIQVIIKTVSTDGYQYDGTVRIRAGKVTSAKKSVVEDKITCTVE